MAEVRATGWQPLGHGLGHGTESVCPVCLRTVQAQRRRDGADVVLAKHCPEHGDFEAVIWRGTSPAFADWTRPKTPSRPGYCRTEVQDGCPYDCGLCPDHRQHTCTALLELTRRCNLGCAFCFASAGGGETPDPNLETVGFWYDQALASAADCTIQLSGGEPTLREDLEAIIVLGKTRGVSFLQLNTNGLRLAEEPGYAERLRAAGLDSVFLQFDGVDDAVYERLRGRPLWEQKQRAVQHCLAAGLGLVLVPTLVPGVNDGQLGAILRYALAQGANLRGVHFQPVSYFGRFPGQAPGDTARLTLPELMRGLETQTEGLVRAADFRPPGCEHALCSFHATYLRTPEKGGLTLLGQPTGAPCCCPPPTAAEGADQAKAFTARQWSGAVEQAASTAANDFDAFIHTARTWSFSLSAMAFQDAWTLDLERLRGCCIHVVAEDGRLVPFCAYNLTAADGRALYRKEPS